MTSVHDADRIIIGCDPGMAAGKPLAVVALAFWGDEAMVVARAAGAIKRNQSFMARLNLWASALYDIIAQCRHYEPPIIVAVEQARGVGGRGYSLQALVQHLVEFCQTENGYTLRKGAGDPDIDVMTVHPIQAKKLITGSGKASAEEVGRCIRITVQNVGILPTTRGWDWEAAAGIAVAANAILKQQAMELDQ